MKKIRILTAAALIACMTFALAACGNENQASAPAETKAESKTETKEASAAETKAESTTETKEASAPEATQEPAAPEATEEPAAPPQGAITGGWEINDVAGNNVSADAQGAFDKAIEAYVGMNLEPKALLATQVVAGTNYVYLCTGERVVQNPVKGWYVVVVYNDLQGNAQITSVEEIEILDIETEDDLDEELVGGFTIQSAPEADVLEASVKEAFDAAAQKNLGVSLYPVAQLASQLVSGNNYLILCQGETVTKDPVKALYIVKMYVPLSGEAEFSEVELFDLEDYIDN